MQALELTRRLPAPPSSVYAAWTEPALMRRWLFVADGGVITDVTSDPVEGGRYSILEHRDGRRIDHVGEYQLTDPPHRLRFTLQVPEHFTETTTITVTITADGDSRLVFKQTGIEPDETRPFWEDMLDQLGVLLAGSSHG